MAESTKLRLKALESIVIASSNRDKARELQTVAMEFRINLVSAPDVKTRLELDSPPEVDESGATYYENARLKAQAYAAWSGLPSLADDSGLDVYALDNRPGVHSARYAGAETSHDVKMEHLLKELAEAISRNPNLDRSACFRCALVLAYPDGRELSAEAKLEGKILEARRGAGGFGYDPIVEITCLGKTLAEIEFEETCRIGFRAMAARDLFAQLIKSE